MKRRIVAALVLTFVLVVTAGLAFFLGTKQAQDGLSIKRVTATELADAMKGDHFYADYGESTLLVAATVSALSTRGHDVIAKLETNSTFQTLCDLGTQPPKSGVGDRITVLAEGASAQRQPSAVLLTGCIVP